MKKLLLALVLSAAIFWLTPTTHVKNSEHTAATITPQHRASTPTVTAPAPTVTQASSPAPQPPVAQPQGCEAYLPLIERYQWDVHTAYAVMQAENRSCNPATDNAGVNSDGSVDYGLFQINSIHADMVGGNLESLRDPATNVRIAYQIYSGPRGWYSWSTYNSGAYLAHL